jgi:hypothetical protein
MVTIPPIKMKMVMTGGWFIVLPPLKVDFHGIELERTHTIGGLIGIQLGYVDTITMIARTVKILMIAIMINY